MTYIKKFLTAEAGYKWKCYNSDAPIFYWRVFNVRNHSDENLLAITHLDIPEDVLGHMDFREGDPIYFSADSKTIQTVKITESVVISSISLFPYENHVEDEPIRRTANAQ